MEGKWGREGGKEEEGCPTRKYKKHGLSSYETKAREAAELLYEKTERRKHNGRKMTRAGGGPRVAGLTNARPRLPLSLAFFMRNG